MFVEETKGSMEHRRYVLCSADTVDEVFAGKLEMNAIDLNERWALSLRYDGTVAPGGFNDDFRDWNAIREWATKVRSQLSKV